MITYLNYNGKLFNPDQKLITADNRGLRYGDGLFETMRVSDHTIHLAFYHFERLFDGIRLLLFNRPSFFTEQFLSDQILSLCTLNNHQRKARVRLMIFRGKGGLFDPENSIPNYIIQTWPLEETDTLFNSAGLNIDIYYAARKCIDGFSHLKSNNYLPYLMAALHAGKHHLDDCVVLNSNGNVCESAIANIFIVKNNQVLTPPLSEGCVAGVMRRFLLDRIAGMGISIQEEPLSVADLADSDEIFLTNAVQGIRWVKRFNNRMYGHSFVSGIHHSL